MGLSFNGMSYLDTDLCKGKVHFIITSTLHPYMTCSKKLCDKNGLFLGLYDIYILVILNPSQTASVILLLYLINYLLLFPCLIFFRLCKISPTKIVYGLLNSFSNRSTRKKQKTCELIFIIA